MTVAMGAAVFVLISLSCLEQRDFSRRGLRAGRWIVREGFQIFPAQHPAHPALDLRDIAVDRGQVLNERVLELQVRQRLVRKLDDGAEAAFASATVRSVSLIRPRTLSTMLESTSPQARVSRSESDFSSSTRSATRWRPSAISLITRASSTRGAGAGAGGACPTSHGGC